MSSNLSAECSANLSFCQKGFSSMEFLAGLVVVGLISSSLLPSIKSTVDSADYSALSYARSALISALEVNKLMIDYGKNHALIDGQRIPVIAGYPVATELAMRNYAILQDFNIDELNGRVQIWSPGQQYCFYYDQPSTSKTGAGGSLIGEIHSAESANCS